jgi:nicotinamidase/pyrazinamidase
LFEKKTTDLLATPEAGKLIEELGADEFVVYGVATEICVQFAAFGLLRRGNRVTVVEDAVMHLDSAKADAFWSELKRMGGETATSAGICA